MATILQHIRPFHKKCPATAPRKKIKSISVSHLPINLLLA